MTLPREGSVPSVNERVIRRLVRESTKRISIILNMMLPPPWEKVQWGEYFCNSLYCYTRLVLIDKSSSKLAAI